MDEVGQLRVRLHLLEDELTRLNNLGRQITPRFGVDRHVHGAAVHKVLKFDGAKRLVPPTQEISVVGNARIAVVDPLRINGVGHIAGRHGFVAVFLAFWRVLRRYDRHMF